MVIRVNGIEFEPYKWNFSNDGMWGHIYFLVPADTFVPDANNGAYAWDRESVEKEGSSSDEHEMSILNPAKHQIVHMATPCMGFNGVDGDDCEKHKLSDILIAAAKDIILNLRLDDKTS